MSLHYEHSIETIVSRLTLAHNPEIARIRAEFFNEENEFFRQNIVNQNVLVAGSGLGHDSFQLAQYN